MKPIACLIVLGLWQPAGGAPDAAPFDTPWLGYDAAFYPDGNLSRASRAADFNGDGVPDLAIVSGDQLALLAGDGGGRFLPPALYPTLLHGLDLEVGDFDGDKDIDVAVCDTGAFYEGTTVSLFDNLGTGTFAMAGSFAAGGAPSGICTADFNGDGWLDLAVAHDKYIDFDNSIAVLLNNAQGGFFAPQVITMTTGTENLDAGDLDGDGDPDIVVAHKTNKITVVRNDGGAFTVQPAQTAAACIHSDPLANVTLADVDLDGDLDALYSHRECGGFGMTGAITLFRNNLSGGGAGALTGEPLPLDYSYGGAVNINVADVNADGWPDVLTATESSQVWMVSLGNGSGGFLPAVRFRATEDPISINALDLDGDDDLDVAVIGRDSLEVAVYLNQPQPGQTGFAEPASVVMACEYFASAGDLASGDIDSDGDVDLITGVSSNMGPRFAVRRNNGDGTFAPSEFLSTPHFAEHLLLRDIDSDGDLDIVWAPWQTSPRFRVRYNNGQGQFGPDVLGPMPPAAEVTALDAYDVDDDGDLDVIMGYLFALGVSKNNNGSFAAFQPHALPVAPSAVAMGDFNEDGHLDLLTNSGSQGYVQRSLGNGNGTFAPPVTFPTGRGVTGIAVADVNDDGNLDFVVAFNLDGVGMSVRLGDGAGGFLPFVSYHGSFSATWDQTDSIELVDADGDGDLDAFSANFGSQDVSYWASNGDGTFQPLIRLGAGLPATDVDLADVNGDDAPDILVLAEHDGLCGVLYPAVTILPGTAPPTLGDITGDGNVNVDDLLAVINAWGICPPACPADIHGDGTVDVDDLLMVINNWS